MSRYLTERAQVVRRAMDRGIAAIADDPAAVNESVAMIRRWKPGPYAAGDVRAYEGIPYKCVQAHDSTANPDWTPTAYPAGWMQYHGTSPATARPWVAPTGAHDMYKAGEFMVWTDGQAYRCTQDTNYSPVDLPAAWEAVEKAPA